MQLSGPHLGFEMMTVDVVLLGSEALDRLKSAGKGDYVTGGEV